MSEPIRPGLKRRFALLLLGIGASGSFAHGAQAIVSAHDLRISLEDVTLFFRVYDAAQGHPAPVELQRDYLDSGSAQLHTFANLRQLTGESLVHAIDAHPDDYSGAKHCVKTLNAVRRRAAAALMKLGRLYPAAKFPPVTLLIGRDNSGGTTSQTGVLIGLEKVCAASWIDPNPENRLVHVIGHEYAHVQQPMAQTDATMTVVSASLIEGGAEFIDELISGSVLNTQLARWTHGRTKAIEIAFEADEDKTDLSAWLYNGPGTKAKPGDLGYWVGYRIVKAYYRNAGDRRRAVRDILEISDGHAFLIKSGWHPGMHL